MTHRYILTNITRAEKQRFASIDASWLSAIRKTFVKITMLNAGICDGNRWSS